MLGEKIQLFSKKTKLQFVLVKQEAEEDWVTPEWPLLLQSMLMPALSLELHSPRKPGAPSRLSVCWLLLCPGRWNMNGLYTPLPKSLIFCLIRRQNQKPV